MIPAAVPTTPPDARTPSGRGSTDGAPQDNGFNAALAQTAPDSAAPKAGATVAVTVVPDAGQGIAALLAKLASGATSQSADAATAASGKASTSAGSDPDGDAKTATSDKGADDAEVPASTIADPLLTLAALLPGIVVGPSAASMVPTSKTPTDAAKLSAALGDASIAKTLDGSTGLPGATAGGEATAAKPNVDFTLVGSATHLAPVVPAALPQAAAAPSAGVSKFATGVATGNEGGSSSAVPDLSAQDAAPAAAVAPHGEPVAGLPDGTLQAIAGAVTTLAADAAPSAGDVIQSAPAALPDPTPTSVAPARSLTLQLNPENLGSVTVRLHLTAGGLDVALAVDDKNTLASISQARDDLAQAIGSNGYRVESLVIRGADASSTSTAGSNDSARSQSESGAGQGFSGGGAGSSGGDASSSRQRSPQASPAARDPGRDGGNLGVFV